MWISNSGWSSRVELPHPSLYMQTAIQNTTALFSIPYLISVSHLRARFDTHCQSHVTQMSSTGHEQAAGRDRRSRPIGKRKAAEQGKNESERALRSNDRPTGRVAPFLHLSQMPTRSDQEHGQEQPRAGGGDRRLLRPRQDEAERQRPGKPSGAAEVRFAAHKTRALARCAPPCSGRFRDGRLRRDG
jgi:hypothetical protein